MMNEHQHEYLYYVFFAYFFKKKCFIVSYLINQIISPDIYIYGISNNKINSTIMMNAQNFLFFLSKITREKKTIGTFCTILFFFSN